MDRETAERRFHLWFFRDLTDAQRNSLFKLWFHPTVVGQTHGEQTAALRKGLSTLTENLS